MRVEPSAQQHADLQVVDRLLHRIELRAGLGERHVPLRVVGLRLREVEVVGHVAGAAHPVAVGPDQPAQGVGPAYALAGRVGIVPETGLGRPGLQRRQLFLLGGDVKDTPASLRGAS